MHCNSFCAHGCIHSSAADDPLAQPGQLRHAASSGAASDVSAEAKLATQLSMAEDGLHAHPRQQAAMSNDPLLSALVFSCNMLNMLNLSK